MRRLGETLGEGGEPWRAVAGAAERFLREEGLEWGAVPEAYLDQLLFRGLLAAGQEEAARRWEAARLPAGHGLRAFDPSVWPGPVPLAAWELFESGAVRPERALAVDGRMAWILDFRRMAPGDEGWMELTLFPGLRRLLEWLAPAWDARGGRGALGLRGLHGTGFSREESEAVRRHCGAVLERVAAARGWGRVPEVVFVDFDRMNKRPGPR